MLQDRVRFERIRRGQSEGVQGPLAILVVSKWHVQLAQLSQFER